MDGHRQHSECGQRTRNTPARLTAFWERQLRRLKQRAEERVSGRDDKPLSADFRPKRIGQQNSPGNA